MTLWHCPFKSIWEPCVWSKIWQKSITTIVKVTLCLVFQNWVTSYSLSYSNDTNIWFYYKDPNLLEAKVLQASSAYVRSAISLSLWYSFCFSYPFVSVIFLSLYFPSFSLWPLSGLLFFFFFFFWVWALHFSFCVSSCISHPSLSLWDSVSTSLCFCL